MAEEPNQAVKDVADTPAVQAPAVEEPKVEPEVSDPIDWNEEESKESKEKPEPKAEVKEAKAEPEAKPEEKPEPDKPPTDEPKVEEPKAEETKPTKAEERKLKLSSEIRELVAKKNELKKQVEKANSEVYHAATPDELTDTVNPDTGENYTKLEAKVEAQRQSAEMERYNNQVADAQLTIEAESQKVLSDFTIFNPDSEDYDKELADEAGSLLQANLITDPETGQVIGSNVSPYQLYKTIARAAGVSAAKGQIKGQAAAEKMLANADSNSNAAPPKEKKDPLMDMLSNWDSDD